MCKDCFQEEIAGFSSMDEYLQLDLILTTKLANDKTMVIDKFVNTAWKDLGYWIYKCNSCGQKWKVSPPDEISKGYLLRM